MFIQSWTEITINSFQALWKGFIQFLPNLIGALVVFLIGWAIAVALGRLVTQIFKALRINQVVDKLGLAKAQFKLEIDKWLGILTQWFFILVFLMAAADILRLTEVTSFLKSVILYVPHIIVAIVILLIAIWIAGALQKIVKTSISVGQLKGANFLASLTKWVIMVFAFLAALMQLGVAYGLIQTLVTGLVAMLALAGGLAFGLGGKDEAAIILKKIRRSVSEDSSSEE